MSAAEVLVVAGSVRARSNADGRHSRRWRWAANTSRIIQPGRQPRCLSADGAALRGYAISGPAQQPVLAPPWESERGLVIDRGSWCCRVGISLRAECRLQHRRKPLCARGNRGSRVSGAELRSAAVVVWSEPFVLGAGVAQRGATGTRDGATAVRRRRGPEASPL